MVNWAHVSRNIKTMDRGELTENRGAKDRKLPTHSPSWRNILVKIWAILLSRRGRRREEKPDNSCLFLSGLKCYSVAQRSKKSALGKVAVTYFWDCAKNGTKENHLIATSLPLNKHPVRCSNFFWPRYNDSKFDISTRCYWGVWIGAWGAKRLTNRVICVIEVELDRHHLRGWRACVTEKTAAEA